MTDEQYIDLITVYLDQSITPEERERLNALIDAGKIDILDIKAMENTYSSLGKLPSTEPSERMSDSFYAMLKAKKKEQSPGDNIRVLNRVKKFFTPPRMQRFGLAVAFVLIGVMVGNLFTPFRDYQQQMDQLSQEISQMREVMMFSLLDAQSSSERLKAVNISTDIPSADNRVISALLKTLNSDPNVNVRLASIEALLHHADNPVARKGLVQSISQQESPQIQVALADAMLSLQETASVNELRRLLKQQELDESVKDKLQNTIAALKS